MTQLVQISSTFSWFVCRTLSVQGDGILVWCFLNGYLNATSVPFTGAVAFLFHVNDNGSDHWRPIVELLINNWDIAQVTRILESTVSLSSSLRMLDESSSRTANRVSSEFGTGSVRQVDAHEPGNGFCDFKICLLKMRPTSKIFLASSSERSCDIDSDSKDPTVALEVKTHHGLQQRLAIHHLSSAANVLWTVLGVCWWCSNLNQLLASKPLVAEYKKLTLPSQEIHMEVLKL